MKFDAMAAAVDWLDTYRSGDIEAILNMYSDDAVTECACEGISIAGRDGLRAYWERRIKSHPASDLNDLRPCTNGATISYLARNGIVSATLEFDATGRIVFLRCGPSGAAGSRPGLMDVA